MTDKVKRGLKKGTTNNPNGRPKKEATVVLYKRVPEKLFNKCLAAVEKVLNESPN